MKCGSFAIGLLFYFIHILRYFVNLSAMSAAAIIQYLGIPLQKQHKLTAGSFDEPSSVLSCYRP